MAFIHCIPHFGATLGRAEYLAFGTVCLEREGNRPALNHLRKQNADNLARSSADLFGDLCCLADQNTIYAATKHCGLRTHASIVRYSRKVSTSRLVILSAGLLPFCNPVRWTSATSPLPCGDSGEKTTHRHGGRRFNLLAARWGAEKSQKTNFSFSSRAASHLERAGVGLPLAETGNPEIIQTLPLERFVSCNRLGRQRLHGRVG